MTVALAVVLGHVGGPTHGFADGLLHPVLGPDHLVAMIAVGIVAAIAATNATPRGPGRGFGVWAAPAAFLTGMTLGGTIGLAGSSFPAVEVTIAVSVLALGIAVAGAIRTSAVGVPVLVLAGLAHGNAHGVETPIAANPALYALGFLAATVMLHAGGVAAGTALRRAPVLRFGVGAAVAAAGMMLLA